MAVTVGPVAISEKFASVCSPVIGSNYDTCGTVTRSTIAHLTVSQLNSLFAPGGLFADLDAWFKHSIEMKACGTKRNVLYDWIYANSDMKRARAALNGVKAMKGPSLLQPFIFGTQDSIENRGHFKITTGFATGSYTPGADRPLSAEQIATTAGGPGEPLVSGADRRIIRVEPRHDVPADANWFRNRDSVHIFDRSAGVSRHGHWRVIASALASDRTYIDVVIETQNTGSSEPYNATPTSGYLIPGVTNVNDYERWCQNLPNTTTKKRVPFFYQTFRYSRCVNSEYKAVYRRLLESNPAFREFGDMDLAKRNAQDEVENQMRFVNDFFFNKPLSVNQTLELWQNLPQISTPEGAGLVNGLGGNVIGYRANFVGVKEQLRLCDRVFDLQNQTLKYREFLQLNYDMWRVRKSQNRPITTIDWWTSSMYREKIFQAYIAFMQDYYGNDNFFQYDLASVKNHENTELGISFDLYQHPWPAGLKIAVMSDDYFDDRRNEFSQVNSDEAGGNLLLSLDIGTPGPQGGTIYWARIATNRKVHSTAGINELAKVDSTYRCVMEALSIEQTLVSETGTPIVECPLASAWVEGFNDTIPDISAPSSSPYGILY